MPQSTQVEHNSVCACHGPDNTCPSIPGTALLHDHFLADFECIRRHLSTTIAALRDRGIPVPVLGSVEIVLGEVLNNITEHAYGTDDPGDICVTIRLCSAGLCILVSDRGAGLPDAKVPLGAPAVVDVPVASLPEGGYGWMLIRTIAKELKYKRIDGVNQLSFELPVNEGPTPATAG